jgi:hypothetical protein
MGITRLTPEIDLDGISPDQAFAILGNEIRISIIRELWQADAAHRFDDGSDSATAISYSELRSRAGLKDNGKFNYHLSKLAPQFVRQTEEGYRLSGAGKQIARTVIAVSGTGDLDFSTELQDDCPFCGAPLAATYEDQWLRIRCTGCDGLFGDQAPKGTLFLTTYPAAGLAARDPERALDAGLFRCALDITYLMYGVCRECAGPISSSVTVCETHERETRDPCTACGTPFPAWADMRCETCGFAKRLPVEMFVTGLVSVVGFFEENEIDSLVRTLDGAFDVLQQGVETSVSRNPVRIDVTIELERTKFHVTVDEEMNVVDRDRTIRSNTPT